jgi:hypothetical protein
MRISIPNQTLRSIDSEIPPVKEHSIEDIKSSITAVVQESIHNEGRSTRMQSELALSGQLQRSNLQAQVGVLAVGSSGPQVLELQKDLNKVRIAQGKPPLTADGMFGPKTEAAVKEFQREQGLKPDGLVGPQTKAALALENLKLEPDVDPVTLDSLLQEFQGVIKETDAQVQRERAEQLLKKILDEKLLKGSKAIPEFGAQEILTDPDRTDDLDDK